MKNFISFLALSQDLLRDAQSLRSFMLSTGICPEQKDESKTITTSLILPRSNLRCDNYLKSVCVNRLFPKLLSEENKQILFGDGCENRLMGIAKNENVRCISKLTDRWMDLKGCSIDIDAKGHIDLLNFMVVAMTFNQFTPNAIVLHPLTANKYFDVHSIEQQDKRISIVQCPHVPEKYYFIGDFYNGAELIDYGCCSVDFPTSHHENGKNAVDATITEKVDLIVYDYDAFAYGKLSDVVEALKKYI